MSLQQQSFSRRQFGLCRVIGATSASAGAWPTPREAETRGLVTLIKDTLHRSQWQC
jgi:hypothetical protein